MSTDTKATKGEKWFVVDAATKRTAPTKGGNDTKDLDKQIAEIQKSSLSAELKASTIATFKNEAALKSQVANVKPFALAISRTTKEGMRDLIEVSGGFKSKQLSPTLVAAIVDNVEFVSDYLKTVFAADE